MDKVETDLKWQSYIIHKFWSLGYSRKLMKYFSLKKVDWVDEQLSTACYSASAQLSKVNFC